MSIQTPGAIWKFKEFNNVDKAYTIKLLGSTVSGILMGVVSGIVYESSGDRLGWFGLAFYFLQAYLLGLFVKKSYGLKDMSPIRAMRHGIMMGFFVYLYLWVSIFNFILFY